MATLTITDPPSGQSRSVTIDGANPPTDADIHEIHAHLFPNSPMAAPVAGGYAATGSAANLTPGGNAPSPYAAGGAGADVAGLLGRSFGGPTGFGAASFGSAYDPLNPAGGSAAMYGQAVGGASGSANAGGVYPAQGGSNSTKAAPLPLQGNTIGQQLFSAAQQLAPKPAQQPTPGQRSSSAVSPHAPNAAPQSPQVTAPSLQAAALARLQHEDRMAMEIAADGVTSGSPLEQARLNAWQNSLTRRQLLQAAGPNAPAFSTGAIKAYIDKWIVGSPTSIPAQDATKMQYAPEHPGPTYDTGKYIVSFGPESAPVSQRKSQDEILQGYSPIGQIAMRQYVKSQEAAEDQADAARMVAAYGKPNPTPGDVWSTILKAINISGMGNGGPETGMGLFASAEDAGKVDPAPLLNLVKQGRNTVNKAVTAAYTGRSIGQSVPAQSGIMPDVAANLNARPDYLSKLGGAALGLTTPESLATLAATMPLGGGKAALAGFTALQLPGIYGDLEQGDIPGALAHTTLAAAPFALHAVNKVLPADTSGLPTDAANGRLSETPGSTTPARLTTKRAPLPPLNKPAPASSNIDAFWPNWLTQTEPEASGQASASAPPNRSTGTDLADQQPPLQPGGFSVFSPAAAPYTGLLGLLARQQMPSPNAAGLPMPFDGVGQPFMGGYSPDAPLPFGASPDDYDVPGQVAHVWGTDGRRFVFRAPGVAGEGTPQVGMPLRSSGDSVWTTPEGKQYVFRARTGAERGSVPDSPSSAVQSDVVRGSVSRYVRGSGTGSDAAVSDPQLAAMTDPTQFYEHIANLLGTSLDQLKVRVVGPDELQHRTDLHGLDGGFTYEPKLGERVIYVPKDFFGDKVTYHNAVVGAHELFHALDFDDLVHDDEFGEGKLKEAKEYSDNLYGISEFKALEEISAQTRAVEAMRRALPGFPDDAYEQEMKYNLPHKILLETIADLRKFAPEDIAPEESGSNAAIRSDFASTRQIPHSAYGRFPSLPKSPPK